MARLGKSAPVLLVLAATLVVPAGAARAVPSWRTPQSLQPVPATEVVPSKPADNLAARLAAQAAPVPTPVWPTAAAVRVTSSQLRVETLDRTRLAPHLRDGLVVRLSTVDGKVAPKAEVSLGYGGFASAYGGDWAGRLRATIVPECALTTPDAPACRPTPVPSRNDRVNSRVVTDVAAPAILALLAGDSSTTGDFTATSLEPSATWSGGGSTGNFTWSYPLRVPPSLGGPAPQIGFSYSSQSLDGLTSATNNQASWLGDGFAYDPGFIERRYKACADDGHPGTGDQCWGSDNATMALSGRGGELIRYSTNPDLWRPIEDDGTRVERLRHGSNVNGDGDGEYWKMTATDGTQYFFGRHRLPGWQSGGPETNSVSYVPVFGDDAGEPCYQAVYASAWCAQAYRWQLDYVVDTHGNTMSFWYTRQTNNYSRNLTDGAVSTYVRANHLARIDYGTDNRSTVDSTFTGTPPARVVFTLADRCALSSGCATHDLAHWPDVPWDRECASATSCAGRYAPTFWSTTRLSTVTTQVATGTQAWKDVESWALGVQWITPAGGDQTKVMWLNTVTATGRNGTEPDIALPSIVFNPTATIMANRVNAADSHGAFRRYRLGTIANELGGVLAITYSAPDCTPGSRMPAAPESNTYRCFPVHWTPPGGSQILDYFHKYVITGVGQTDNAGGNSPQYTTYTYPTDGAFWHYDESELTPVGKKTYGHWRGYEQVTVTEGDGTTGTQLVTVSKFFRGKHGDRLPTGSRTQTYTVNGVSYNDENWLAGMLREEVTYNGPGGATVTTTASEPWWSGPTASRTVDGVTTHAYATGKLRTTVRTTLDSGRPDRLSTVQYAYTDGTDGTPRGRLLTVDDQGDPSTSSDDTCTRYTYARNDGAHLHSLVSEVETDALRCAVPPTQGREVLSALRTWYDGGPTFPTTPTKGDVTRTQQLSTWQPDPAGRIYTTTSRSTHDAYGRALDSYDALNRKTSTSYSPASGAPVISTTVTNPKLWATTTQLEPAWGVQTRTTDPNGRVTDVSYDSLGRATAVWKPGWAKADHPSLPSEAYAYLVRSSGGPTAVTTSKLNTDGTGHWLSYQLYDGFLRPRQTQGPAMTGSGRVVTDMYHDSRGLVTRTNDPYYTTGTAGTTLLATADHVVPAQQRTAFDGAGRPIQTQLVSLGVERSRTTTSYGGDRVDVTPPTGGTATSTVTNARGLRTEVRQYRGATPTPGTPGSYDRTTYAYDGAGRQTSMQDHAGNTWTWAYDQRGRVTTTVDPDKGTVTASYDDAGRATSTVDARGVRVSYVYDELDRRTEVWQGMAGTGTKLAEFAFDTLAKGRPTSSTRFAGGQPYAVTVTGYDASYRPTGTEVSIPAAESGLGGTYAFGTTYTANGSMASRTLPAAGGLGTETLTTTYTGMGQEFTLTGATAYVTETTYLQTGRLTSMTHDTFTAYRSYSYDPVTGRLTHLNAQAASTPSVLQETDYHYDPAGNIVKVSDLLEQYGPGSGTDDTQCLSYDYLRRLTSAWTPDSNNCATAPSVAGLGGPAPYWLSWTYDSTGNRTGQTRYTAGGNQTTTYAYPAAGQPRPHALSATSGATTGTYAYDTSGSTTSRPGTTAQQTLTWDAEGHLATVTEGANSSSYTYDATGERLVTRDPNGRTLHLPMGMEVRVNASGGGATATRLYAYAGRAIASRTAGTGLSWLFNDHQGTASIALRDSDLAITRRYQTPFGPARGSAANWPNQRGFVDGYADATGLVHLGARELDPATGRFLSVDPVIDLGDPQQMHGYSYANNSPITMSDPDGLRPCESDYVCGHSPSPKPNISGSAIGAAVSKAAAATAKVMKAAAVAAIVAQAKAAAANVGGFKGHPAPPAKFNGRPADYIVFEATIVFRTTVYRPPVDIPDDLKKRQPGNQLEAFKCQFTWLPFSTCTLTQQGEGEWVPPAGVDAKTDRLYKKMYGGLGAVRETTVTGGVILTRNGEVYLFAGTVVPGQKTSSSSVRWGWIDSPQPATDKEISEFVNGESVAVSINGFGGQVSASRSTATSSYVAVEAGFTDAPPGWSWSLTVAGRIHP